jgi:hypothetical protein
MVNKIRMKVKVAYSLPLKEQAQLEIACRVLAIEKRRVCEKRGTVETSL